MNKPWLTERRREVLTELVKQCGDDVGFLAMNLGMSRKTIIGHIKGLKDRNYIYTVRTERGYEVWPTEKGKKTVYPTSPTPASA
jgi:DNA-binding MarR family transcriptional regulator